MGKFLVRWNMDHKAEFQQFCGDSVYEDGKIIIGGIAGVKKKVIVALVVITTIFAVTACDEKSSQTKPSINTANGSQEEDITASSQTIDGITITAETFSVEPYEDASGEYTRRIVMPFSVKNDTDTAFGYVTDWDAKMDDGYELESFIDIMSMDLKQAPSNGEITDTAYFLIDDSVDPNQIIVSYNFMDYDAEYWEDFGKIISGEMSENEYTKKYSNYDTLTFTVNKE